MIILPLELLRQGGYGELGPSAFPPTAAVLGDAAIEPFGADVAREPLSPLNRSIAAQGGLERM